MLSTALHLLETLRFPLISSQQGHSHGVYCRNKPGIYEVLLGEDFDSYLNSMAQEGTWGDELTLVRLLLSQIQDGK